MNALAKATSTSLKDSIQNSQNWRDAAQDCIDFYSANNLCFSSGEIAAEVRKHRTDLRFSVLSLGEYVRDLYYNGAVNYKDSYGDDFPGLQMARSTSGVGRTPAGVTVFVYGPDAADIQNHDFEVDIPAPGGKAITQSNPIRPKSGYPTAISKPAVSQPAQPALPQPSMVTATVHTDRRLCLTRPIFDKFIAASGQAIHPGTPVYVLVTDDEAVISLDSQDGAHPYNLQKERGRVLFPRANNPFEPGERYEVFITASELKINLKDPVSG